MSLNGDKVERGDKSEDAGEERSRLSGDASEGDGSLLCPGLRFCSSEMGLFVRF